MWKAKFPMVRRGRRVAVQVAGARNRNVIVGNSGSVNVGGSVGNGNTGNSNDSGTTPNVYRQPVALSIEIA